MGEAVVMLPFHPRAREAPAPVIDHRRFGPLRASFQRDSEGLVWECLDLVPTSRGLADLEFEAGAWGPTVAHELQLDMITLDLDALTYAAGKAVADEVQECTGLEWQGARLTGRSGDFQLHFWCAADSELLVKVSFQRSQPTTVELHD